MADSNRVTSATVRFPVWWGTRKDLERLLGLILNINEAATKDLNEKLKAAEEEFRSEAAEQMARFAKSVSSEIAADGGDPGPFATPEKMVRQAAMLSTFRVPYELDAANEAMQLTSTFKLKSWDEQRTGNPFKLLDEGIEEDEVVVIETGFGRRSRPGMYLAVTLDKRGSEAEVIGPQSLVASAIGQLERELKKQTTKMGWIFIPWVQATLSGIAGIILYLNVATPGGGVAESVVLSIGCFVASWLVFGFLPSWVPKFDLVHAGRPRAKAWGIGVLSVAGSAAVGLLVNIVSKALGF